MQQKCLRCGDLFSDEPGPHCRYCRAELSDHVYLNPRGGKGRGRRCGKWIRSMDSGDPDERERIQNGG